MSIRAQAPIEAAPIGLNNINKARFRSSSRRSRYRNHSLDSRKRFTPKVNKSFTCYQGDNKSQLFKKNRSYSVEKPKNALPGDVSPTRKNSTIRGRSFKNNGKLSSPYPDFEGKTQKKEIVQAWIDMTHDEMQLGRFESALNFISKALQEEPNNLDAIYTRALCNMKLGEYKKAIPDLLVITREFPMSNKEAYVSLSMCFVATGEVDTAVRQLSRGLLKFPKYSQGFVARGQLFNQQKKWQKAMADFYKALELNPIDGNAYLALSETLLGIGDKHTAVKILNQATQCENSCNQALLKRANIHFEEKHYEEALEDLNKFLSFDNENAEAYYYKALILMIKEELNDAVLCLEQVIKYDEEKKFTGAALYNLGAIQIKMKDFYGAIYTFKRASDLDAELKEQKILKGYVDAILNLMKRKFKEGIDIINRIIKKKHPLLQDYIGNCYSYRGYAYCALGKFEKAIKDLKHVSKYQKLDVASQYNLIMSQGAAYITKQPSTSIALFEKAFEMFPKNVEPLAYKASVIIRNNPSKTEMQSAKELLDKSIALRDSESDMYFLRGLLNHCLNNSNEALEDLEAAVDKAEDNVAEHFLVRGYLYSCIGFYKEALQDFSIALQLEENLSEAYLYRGRCAFLMDETEQAFSDFQEYLKLKSDYAEAHFNAGNLLMATGSLEEACKAYSTANAIQTTSHTCRQKAKCHLLLSEIELGKKELKNASALDSSEDLEYDLQVLSILETAITKKDLKESSAMLTKLLTKHKGGEVFKVKHIHWFKGVFFFFLKQYQKALSEFNQAICSKELTLRPSNAQKVASEKENYEVMYNVALCYMMVQDYEVACMHLYEIVDMAKSETKAKLLLLIGILQIKLGKKDEGEEFFKEALKFGAQEIDPNRQEALEVPILPYHSNSYFSGEFPLSKVELGKFHVLIRPTFGVPRICVPSLEFKTDKNILKRFNVKSRPEAPWLNRVKGSIQFTEELQDVISETEPSQQGTDNEDETSVFKLSLDKRQFQSAVALVREESDI